MSREQYGTLFPPGKEVATIGGGCFWCTEAIYRELQGVEKVESGYSGGSVENPTYEQVCTGATGHAEIVQITFDPNMTSFREILHIFFTMHDPTTPNRQGADVGTQYRSVIFYHNDEQKKIAEQVINEINSSKMCNNSIVTKIEPFRVFHRAEGYHQNYFEKKPHQPYCSMVIDPKVVKFRQLYREKLKKR